MESNALDLPEIRTLLGSFLSLDSLRACVLVSKDWHNTFIRIIWTTIYFGPYRKPRSYEPQPPDRATIEKHAHLIQNLVVVNLTPTFRLDLFRGTPLTSLKELHLTPIRKAKVEIIPRLGWIFRQNPGLRVVDYGICRTRSRQRSRLFTQEQEQEQEQEDDVWALLDSCREVVDLTMRYVRFKEEYWKAFQRLCATKLRRLVLFCSPYGFEGVEWGEILMPHLQELEIRTSGSQAAAVLGMKMIVQCPNLRTLRWSDGLGQDPDPSSFHQILEYCPQLETLSLEGMVLPDEVIATFLASMALPAGEGDYSPNDEIYI
ncbi:MAG: hypothetical protein JOS17DRAFT_81845 [Linnemannia elongata]|nr:MAG: hypothetical protein JOS17DRAFT_81845 [Linnemannia elongata]